MRSVSLFAIILMALPLCSCGSVNSAGVTCSLSEFEFSCRVGSAKTQDPLASSEAEDEKPDRPLTEPLLRSEEAPS